MAHETHVVTIRFAQAGNSETARERGLAAFRVMHDDVDYADIWHGAFRDFFPAYVAHMVTVETASEYGSEEDALLLNQHLYGRLALWANAAPGERDPDFFARSLERHGVSDGIYLTSHYDVDLNEENPCVTPGWIGTKWVMFIDTHI